jgi:hypothetical protein
MNVRRFLGSLFFACLLLASAGAAAKKLDPVVLEGIKRVGVASIVGDTLVDCSIGITLFGSSYETYDIPEWRLDDAWQEQLVNAIEALGQFEVVPLSHDDRAAILASFYENVAGVPAKARSDAGNVVAPIAEANDLDAVILLATHFEQIPLGGRSSPQLRKYGVFQFRTLGTSTTGYYFIGRLYFISAAGERLDTQRLEGTPPSLASPYWFPRQPVPWELRYLPFARYAPEQKETLRQVLISLPEPSLAPALAKLVETKKRRTTE